MPYKLTKSLPSWECGLKPLIPCLQSFAKLSLPSWECGLKLHHIDGSGTNVESLPSWECGLKRTSPMVKRWNACHSPRGSVDWNARDAKSELKSNVTPLVGVWIETFHSLTHNSLTTRHSPRGSVDWNTESCFFRFCAVVTPLVGVWIETSSLLIATFVALSLPSWECGLKLLPNEIRAVSKRHSPRGSVDWNISTHTTLITT